MIITRTMKRHDTRPFVVGHIVDANNRPVSITDAVSANFIMKIKGSLTPKVAAVAEILSATEGKLRYKWQAGDTDTAGEYLAEFEVIFVDGTKFSIPRDHTFIIKINEDYNNI